MTNKGYINEIRYIDSINERLFAVRRFLNDFSIDIQLERVNRNSIDFVYIDRK